MRYDGIMYDGTTVPGSTIQYIYVGCLCLVFGACSMHTSSTLLVPGTIQSHSS